MDRAANRSSGNGEWDEDQGVLISILALLLSLSSMAEQACCAPHAHRLFMVDVMRRAESAGLRCVIDLARDLGAPDPQIDYLPGLAVAADSKAELAAIAGRLRALALALTMLLTQAQAIACLTVGQEASPIAAGQVCALSFCETLPALTARSPPDTS